MTVKRVLIVHNWEKTSHGNVGVALEEVGIASDLVMAHLGEPLPTTADAYDALIVFGGGQNALADSDYPYFPQLLDLIRDFEARDRSVLGVCLGGQLIARAFGGSNRIGGATEFGWHTVTLTDKGCVDPVLACAAPTFPIFQWHDDTFALPPGAVHLATGPVAESQAFRVGRATYGIQFHFEADTSLVRGWNTDYAVWLQDNRPDWFERMETEAAVNGSIADAAGLAIARAWVRTIWQPRQS